MVVAGVSETEAKFSRFADFVEVIFRRFRSSSAEVLKIVWEETLFLLAGASFFITLVCCCVVLCCVVGF